MMIVPAVAAAPGPLPDYAGVLFEVRLSCVALRETRAGVKGSQDRDARLSAWMVAAQAGDAAAYQALLRACVPLVASMVRRQGLRGSAVDDAVQDTLLAVHRARATYDPARPFGPWLAAIARRRAIDVIRQLGRRHAREAHDPVAYEGYADVVSDPTTRLDADESASRVRAAVAALPPRQREAVQRLSLAENTLDEVSRETGRSKVALKVNLHRALKALRVRLGESDTRRDSDNARHD